MKVLWIVNIMLPPLSEAMGQPKPAIGGWLYSSAKLLKQLDGIELFVATTYFGEDTIKKEIDGITYLLIPTKSNIAYDGKLESRWKIIAEEICPDIVHIHGTEFPRGLAYVNACGSEKVVASIQGMPSVYKRYSYGGIPIIEVLKNTSIHDVLRKCTLFHNTRLYKLLGLHERQLLSKLEFVIGRTSWDMAHTKAINSKVQYFYCGETLRDVFYTNRWDYNKCKKHSIFLSQASEPLKGLHQVIKALPYILQDYPDTQLYVAGDNLLNRKWYQISSYGLYIKRLIRNYSLEEHIHFLGFLDEERMCAQYLNSNVFICPSSIENSPNSLAEAQMTGTPYLASYVGGVMDIVSNETESLYRFEEVEMLAMKVKSIFAHVRLTKEASKEVKEKYSKEKNLKYLINIYKEIASR